MNHRPCPLCNGTGHIQGPIHSPTPTQPLPTRRRRTPPIIYEPTPTLGDSLKRLRKLRASLTPKQPSLLPPTLAELFPDELGPDV